MRFVHSLLRIRDQGVWRSRSPPDIHLFWFENVRNAAKKNGPNLTTVTEAEARVNISEFCQHFNPELDIESCNQRKCKINKEIWNKN